MTVFPYNIADLVEQRKDQPSFHIAAEGSVRVQFFNLDVAGQLSPFEVEGVAVVTCYAGAFALSANGQEYTLSELDQVVIPTGIRVSLTCVERGTAQVIWAPPAPASE